MELIIFFVAVVVFYMVFIAPGKFKCSWCGCPVGPNATKCPACGEPQ